jgi:hypothetical protein
LQRGSAGEPRFYLSQYLNQTNYVGLFEHAFDTVAVEVGEGSFILPPARRADLNPEELAKA